MPDRYQGVRHSGFTDLRRDAIDVEAADRPHVLVASLEDVIRSKGEADREKNRLSLPRLRRLLDRLRGDEWSRGRVRSGASCWNTSLLLRAHESQTVLTPQTPSAIHLAGRVNPRHR